MKIIKKEEKNQYIVHLKNGTVVTEATKEWKPLMAETNNGNDITSLQIKNGDNIHTVSVKGENIKQYIQLKREIMNMMTGERKLVERVAGFTIADDQGNDKYAIKMTVMEKTKSVVLTLEEFKEVTIKDGRKVKKWIKL